MTIFRIGLNRGTGAVTIWIEAACGLRPILVCADLEGVREFAQMLLDFYQSSMEEKKTVAEVSENLLRQALEGWEGDRSGGE